MTSQTKINII